MTQAELEKHTFHTGMLAFSLPSRLCDADTGSRALVWNIYENLSCAEEIVALTTFFYRGGRKSAKLLAEDGCVNWNRLEDWASGRVIDLSVPGIVLPVEESEQFEQFQILMYVQLRRRIGLRERKGAVLC